jgi:hypothetical protein
MMIAALITIRRRNSIALARILVRVYDASAPRSPLT